MNSGLRERIYDKPTRLESITVSVRTLDALNLPLSSLKFIKIDVEGGEYDVLRGARGCIKRCKPVITFECGESAFVNYGTTREALLNEFFNLGYDLYDIKCNHINDVQCFIGVGMQPDQVHTGDPHEPATQNFQIVDIILHNRNPHSRDCSGSHDSCFLSI